jgi:hypothetical protein
MLRTRLISGCIGALAIGLSSIGATAAPAVPHSTALSAATDRMPIILVRGGGGGGGGGFGGGGGGGFGGGGGSHGGGGFGGGGGFHGGGGSYGGGFAGHGFRGDHHAAYLGAPYYDGGTCYYSSRRGRTICPSY